MKNKNKNKNKYIITIIFLVFYFILLVANSVSAQVNGIDLTPDALFWSPYSIKQSDTIFIGTRVKNLGTEPAGAFRVMLTYNGFFLCSWDVSKLNPNEIFERGPNLIGLSFSEKCVIYSVAPPGYKIKAVVDDLNYIAETNENNNATSTFLTVTPVNVEPSEPSVPGAYVPGYTPSPVSPPSVPPAPAVNQPAQNLNFDFLKGLVPCGTSYANHACTVCDFFVLTQNIINFLLYAFASLATLMAVYIAFLFMFSGGSSAKISDAKSKLWLVLLGIFWVLGSWLVLNTILNFAVNKSVFPWPWNQINCSISQPSSVPGGTGAVGGGGAGAGNTNQGPFEGGSSGGGGATRGWELTLDQAGVYEDAVQINTPGYQALDTEHVGLEQVNPGYSSTIPAVDKADINGVDPNLVKAIIQAESSGNTNAIHIDRDGKASYGLMQVRPDTAKRYDSSLVNLSDAQIGEKLKDPNYNTEIGTAYLQDLASKYGGDLNKVIAAYNGGPGANKASVDCPGSMRWQCQWDYTAQTIPITGYQVTRNYVTKVNSYYSQLSK